MAGDPRVTRTERRLARSTTANGAASACAGLYERPSKSCPPLRTRRRTPCLRPQTTAAWTWEAFVGVTMQSGVAVAGVRNLGFRTDDARTDANDGELWVKRSWFGMDAERHWRKSSELA